jgi:hypothetical protein
MRNTPERDLAVANELGRMADARVVLLSYRKKRGSNHDYFIRPAIHRVRMLARAAQRSLKHFPSTEAAIPVGAQPKEDFEQPPGPK